MLADQQREDGRQKREHEGLHHADEQLEQVERNLDEPADPGNAADRIEHRFAREHVSVQTEAQRDRTEEYRDDLQAAGGEEDDGQEHSEPTRDVALRREELLQEAAHAEVAQRPYEPAREE